MTELESLDEVSQAEMLFDQNELDLAKATAESVLQTNPMNARALQVLGMICSRREQLFEAVPILEKALTLCPDLVPAHNELGLVHDRLGDSETALKHFERALFLQPDHALAHLNRSLTNLKLGRLREGWLEYEWRFLSKSVSRPEIPAPRWDGSSLKGKHLLVHTEQGLGDIFQFARFLPILKKQGARISFACQKSLHPILQSLDGIDEWFPIDQETAIHFDYYTPLLSLPALLNIDEWNDIPTTTPYLFAEKERVEKWKSELKGLEGFRIGICWKGSPTFGKDRYRSFSLKEITPIANLEKVQFISLQKLQHSEQLQPFDNLPIHTLDDLDMDGAFLDTAAIMQSLDLIISADTAIAHLAGALGRPTWVALALCADWRWGMDQQSSPWYPTTKLFRQKQLGNWSTVFGEMERSLSGLIASRI